MDSDLLDTLGGGNAWYLAVAYDLGSVSPNGNYLETDAMGVGHGICGDTPQSGDDNPIVYSTPNSEWPILTEYTAGSIIDIKVVFTNYHWGHIEFFLCDTGDMADPNGVVTQECFNTYPLDRALDDSFNSPVDLDYPGRYYIDPPCRGATGETDQERPEMDGVLNEGYINHMRYQLPDITCERCVLQTRYHSGKGCKSRGYDEFEPDSWPSVCAPNKEDWIAVDSHECQQPDRTWGNLFWACTDITLVAEGVGTAQASPTLAPAQDAGPTPTPSAFAAAQEGGSTPTPPTLAPAQDADPTPTPSAFAAAQEGGSTPTPSTLVSAQEGGSTPTPSTLAPAQQAGPTTTASTSAAAEGGGSTPTPSTFTAFPNPVSSTNTTSPIVDEPVYLGCFTDKNNAGRIMILGLKAPGNMTTAMCALECEGSQLFGTQYGYECWCGDEETNHLQHGESEMCDYSCEGKADEVCGGYWSMSVWEY
ncbi:unnamed protein product [Sphacelaria rigidula]